MHPSMQDRKCLGHGQNVPINQSINRSINQSPRPGPSIYIAFPRPCSAMLQERCHGCCCHASPCLSHAVQHMETRRRPAYYPAYCNRDSCIAGIQGLLRPANIDRMRYRFTKNKIVQVSSNSSTQSQDSLRIQMYFSRLNSASSGTYMTPVVGGEMR
jgi:hypothetical protein